MPDRLPILDSSPLQEPDAVVDHALEESAEELADETYGGRVDPSLGTLAWLKQVGIDDKYIQQDEFDQQAAFQKAFTLEAIFSGGLWLLLLVSVRSSRSYTANGGCWRPALLLTLMVPAVILQSPLWIFYRQLDFARQRKLQAIEPLVAFAVTIGLAVAGAGYWSLLIGALAGVWTSALAALRACLYRLRFRYESGTMRAYARFSWPLFASGLSAVVLVQGSMLVGTRVLGLAAVGIMSLRRRSRSTPHASTTSSPRRSIRWSARSRSGATCCSRPSSRPTAWRSCGACPSGSAWRSLRTTW